MVGDDETTTGKLAVGVCVCACICICICIGPEMVVFLTIGGGEVNMGCAEVAPMISPELFTGCVVLLTTLPVATILACS